MPPYEAREAEEKARRAELWLSAGIEASADDVAQALSMAEKAAAAREAAAELLRAAPRTREKSGAPAGETMGPTTTKLTATVSQRLDNVPTSMVHVLALRGTPLVSVKVKNHDNVARRILVQCHVEGYSATAKDTKEIAAFEEATFDLFPPFLRERLRDVNEVTAASLHVDVADLDGKAELVHARTIALLARTTAVLAQLDPSTGLVVSHHPLLAAWVTPNSPDVLTFLRKSADFSKLKAMLGYQVDESGVREHVRAIFQALKAAEIVYVNSVVAFGATGGQYIQRVRLPRESLADRAANCIDGTVLMASLLEATGLQPVMVLVPGHAFLGYRVTSDGEEAALEYVETTMIGTGTFEGASNAAAANVKKASQTGQMRLLDVRDLRKQGITPME